jgi:hypothetical protein
VTSVFAELPALRAGNRDVARATAGVAVHAESRAVHDIID